MSLAEDVVARTLAARQESYTAEAESERIRAERDQASQYANTVVPAEVEKQRIETLAEAEAERIRRTRQGEADGQRAVMEAEALGLLALLTRRAEGLGSMVASAGGSAELAALLMVTEMMPKLVEEQVKAISNLKIDQVTVWDSGGNGDGTGGSTANFLSGLVGSLPPIHELANNVGIKLPDYLGSLSDDELTSKLREVADRIDEPGGAPASSSPDDLT